MTTPSTPNIDLNPHDLAEVQRILKEYVPQHEVWAFGSRVTWTAKAYSDLDLAIITDKPLSLGTLADLKNAFDESDLSIKVDLVDWATTGEAFRAIIKKTAVAAQVSNNSSHTLARWRERPLGELTDNFDNIRVPVKGADRRAGPYPYYGASGVVDYIDSYLFDGEYLLIAEDGENLRTRNTPIAFLAKDKFWVNNHAHIVRGNSEADTRFIMYALSATDVSGFLTGSTMPKLTQGNMNRIPILTPPLPEQRAIAHILGTLDDKIELNRRMNETLEAMARALFKSWFVDFEPVRAKAEGRDTGLPKEITDLFPDSFEDSELGEIPKGWRVGTLAGLAELNSESWSKDTRPDFIQYVDLTNTKWGRIEATIGCTIAEAPSRAQRVLRPLDTIIGTVRPANGSYAFITDEGLTGSTGFAVLRPKSVINAEFVYLAATSPKNIESLAHLADGGAYPAVRPEIVSATTIILPSESLLQKFSQTVAPLLEKYGKNNRESKAVAEQRDALLPKLLSGEIRATEA